MKLSLLAIIPTLLAPIAAQAKSKCGAQYQVDLCVKNADAVIKNCGNSDPACTCQANKDKAKCYIVCTDDEVNVGQAKQQDTQIQILCNVPGAIPTTVSKSADKPTSTSADSPNATKSSSGNGDKSSDKTSGNAGSSTKSGNSANSQYSSASLVAISMGVIASFL